MFQIDEKVIKDNRTLITINPDKPQIDPVTKNGTLHYVARDKTLWLTTPKVRSAVVNRGDFTEVLDKVVLARDGANIDGAYEFDDAITFNDNVEIKKDLLVRGNFTVEGEASVIDTPSLTVEDNVIELNRNEQGNGITLKHAGVAINRGIREFSRYLFEDTRQAFVLDTSAEIDAEVDNEKWIAMGYSKKYGDYEAGEFTAKYRLSAPNGKFTNGLFVGGTATINKLSVNDTTNLAGALTADGSSTFNGTVTNNNTTTLNGLLTVNARSTFKQPVTMENTLDVYETSVFRKESTFNTGALVHDHFNVNGTTTLSGTLGVSEKATFSKDIAVSANTLTNTLSVSNTAAAKTLTVAEHATIGKSLTVSEGLNVSGDTNVKGLLVEKALDVKGTTTFQNNVAVKYANVTIESSLESNGILTVQGNTVLDKKLTTHGAAAFNSEVVMNDQLLVNDTVTANSLVSNGDISVTQDNNAGYRFGNSDNYKIFLGLTSNYGSLEASSDKNMYFKISGGTNRGFVFKSDTKALAQIDADGKLYTVSSIYSAGSKVLTEASEGHKTDDTGVDSDKVDGLHASSFLRSDENSTLAENKAIYLSDTQSCIYGDSDRNVFLNSRNAITIQANTNGVSDTSKSVFIRAGASEGLKVTTNEATFNGNTVWHKGNQGEKSGLNADLLDGKHAEEFATNDHKHEGEYVKTEDVNLKNKYKIQYNESSDSLDFVYMG